MLLQRKGASSLSGKESEKAQRDESMQTLISNPKPEIPSHYFLQLLTEKEARVQGENVRWDSLALNTTLRRRLQRRRRGYKARRRGRQRSICLTR